MRLGIILFLLLLSPQIAASQPESRVLVLEFKDTITQASSESLGEGLSQAENGYQALILVLDTPGGGLDETINILKQIESSNVPVVGYVYPKGAKAWSAGTVILLGTDIAAMAPYTIIGSSQPVQMSPEGIRPINDSKIINALVALMEEKARMHNRNVSIVKEFVVSNLNLNAEQAKEKGIIEHVAPNIPSLLDQIDGTYVKGKNLSTANSEIIYFSPSLKVYLLSILSNPLLASLLLVIGIYSLIFGISTPGYGAEVFGAIVLILGLIGLGFAVNLAALFLIFLGIGLILAELHSPGFGVLGIAGTLCMIIGSILLVPISYPRWYVSPELQQTLILTLVVPAIIFGGFFAFALYKMMEIRFKKPTVGEILGEEAEALEKITPDSPGYVRYRGEYWKAKSEEEIEKGRKVSIAGKDGSILVVKLK